MIYYTNKEYAKILDGLVLACVDVLVQDKLGNILLGKRTKLPNDDWWIFGGRMSAHESYEQTTSRVIKRELDCVDYEYRGVIGYYLLDWAKRSEQPSNNGCTHLMAATKIVVNSLTEYTISPPESHSEVQIFKPGDITTGDYSEELKEVIRDAFNIN